MTCSKRVDVRRSRDSLDSQCASVLVLLCPWPHLAYRLAVGLLARGRAASFLDLLQLEIEAERLAGRPTDNIELYLPRRAPPPEPPAYTEREREPERRERHEPPRAAAARALEFNPLAILSSSAAQTLYIGQMLLRAPIIPAKQIALLYAIAVHFTIVHSTLDCREISLLFSLLFS